MNPGYSIVPARPEHIEPLPAIELCAATLLRGHAPEHVLAEATSVDELKDAQAEGRLWVALADDSPVGLALVEILDAHTAHLEEVDVHPRHARRGIGAALVNAVLEWAARSAYRQVTLTTFRDVPWNMPFYARLGFEELPRAEWSPALRAIVEDEAARGLDPERRVVMVRTLAMTATYPAVYTDARGVESTSITNDGETLRLLLRGVSLVGPDFDALEPDPADLDRAQTLFTLVRGCLHACMLEWTMPMLVLHQDRAVECPLRARLELGYPLLDGGKASEALLLELATPAGKLRSAGTSGWFEDELLDLARQLHPGDTLRACITCAFSDYSPYGHGLFGNLACFRDAKEAYGRVTGKEQLFDVWDLMTDFVQETYLCDQYLKRAPGTGYRG